MKLQSPVFKYGSSIPKKYTCEGEGVNPPLVISEVPQEAKSLVLIVEDPDAPKSIHQDGVWVHWILYNLDPNTTFIPEKGAPGIAGKNTDGKMGYSPFCPPDRLHRYFFKLYALDKKLDLPPGASKEELLAAMDGHIIEHAQWMGMYEKKHAGSQEISLNKACLGTEPFTSCCMLVLFMVTLGKTKIYEKLKIRQRRIQ